MDHILPGFSVHGNFPGKNIGVGCHALLQGIFLTHGWKPCLLSLLHWQVCSWPLEPLGNPIEVRADVFHPSCKQMCHFSVEIDWIFHAYLHERPIYLFSFNLTLKKISKWRCVLGTTCSVLNDLYLVPITIMHGEENFKKWKISKESLSY